MSRILLTILFPLLSFAMVPVDSYKSCLNASNKLESPADRDAEKVLCFNKGPVKKTLDTCLSLARVLEHTTASDSLIMSCLSDSILQIKVTTCLDTANKMYYSENRDRAIWMCIENKPVKRSKCKQITDDITFPHNKIVVLNYCLMKN
jgi:hypothetical protein